MCDTALQPGRVWQDVSRVMGISPANPAGIEALSEFFTLLRMSQKKVCPVNCYTNVVPGLSSEQFPLSEYFTLLLAMYNILIKYHVISSGYDLARKLLLQMKTTI